MSRVWTLAALAFSLVASATWTAQLVFGGEAFAVVSNTAFAVDIVLVPLIARSYLVEAHPLIYATTLVSAMLMAGSFAHHLDRNLGDPAHTLDLAMVWLLYWHLALLAFYALLQRYVAWPRLLLAVTLLEAAGIVALFSLYATVRRHQMWVLVVCGVAVHGCTLTHRLLSGVRTSEALVDAAALVLLQAVAATVQGEVWVSARSPARYNVEHGYWHVLNGTIVVVVVMQTAQLLDRKGVSGATRADRVCLYTLVAFALVLLVATLCNEGEAVLVGVLVPAQVLMLLTTGVATLWERRSAAIARRQDEVV